MVIIFSSYSERHFAVGSAPKMKPAHKNSRNPDLPHATDWRTTDAQEIAKRRLRAHEEKFHIRNTDARHPIFSNFAVRSASGMTYQTEIRDVASRQFSCTCTDFRINGLGVCKHVEAVLLQLEQRQRTTFKEALRGASPRVDIVPAEDALRVERGLKSLPALPVRR